MLSGDYTRRKNATELTTGDTNVHCVSPLSETIATNLEFLFRRRVSFVQLLFLKQLLETQETVNSNRYMLGIDLIFFSIFSTIAVEMHQRYAL